jgi:hypothetical protein
MAGSGDWEVEFYANDAGREPCRGWMQKLPPTKRIALEVAIQLVLARRGLAVVETEFGRALGGGLYEFRLRWPADEVRRKVEDVSSGAAGRPEKILLRVFFCTSGRKVILLLSGYDKAKDPGHRRQERQIAQARKLQAAHQEAERRRTREPRSGGAPA